MQRTDSLGETLILGKIEGKRRRVQQKIRWLDGITDSVDMSLSKSREIMKGREDCCAAVHGIAKRWTQLSDWAAITGTSWHHRSCTIALECDHLLLWQKKLSSIGAPRGLNVCGFTERIVSFLGCFSNLYTLFFKLTFIGTQVIYNVVFLLYNKVNQLYIYTRFFRLCSNVCHFRVLSRVLCAVW